MALLTGAKPLFSADQLIPIDCVMSYGMANSIVDFKRDISGVKD